MSKISIYEVVPVPKLADKLVGTSVGGDPEDITYNFTLSDLLNLFIPNIPGNTLQGVLDFGNTATQNINLTGIITTTTLNVGSTANILNSNLTGQTKITGGLYDRLNSIGTAGQVLTSTGTQVEWYTIPTVIPDLQQVLTSGNTAVNNIILTGNLSANNAALLTSTISTSLTVLGTLKDGLSSVGTNNQVLSSNVTGVRWVNLPVYSATSPLLYNSGTGVFSIQQANASQNGYLSSADWITFDGKQTAISLTTTGNSGASTLVGATINVPNYTLSGLGGVPQTRTLTINGVTFNLSADRTWTLATGVSSVSATTPLFSTGGANPDISIQQSSSSLDGYLSSTDWLTFNSKQPAGNYITSLTGEATAAGPGAASVILSNAAVIGKLLTGLSITGSAISSSDSILTAFGKVQNQINGLIGGVQFQGVWNAATNTPALVSSVGTQGYYYIVDVAGNTNLNGITDWQVGDWAIFNGSTWNKVDNTDLVTSVNGQVGAVSLTTDNIPEGATNLYYLDSRARAALSFAAGSGAYNSTTGVITIPTDNSQILNGAGYITLVSLSATSPLTYNNTTGAFAIQVANTTQDGYLSSTDWNTFNGKQPFLGGTGLVKSVAGVISYITDNSANWNTAYNDSIVSAAVTGTATKTLTLNQQDGGTITASWSDIDTGLTSVGVSMPSAFTVTNSPLTSNGTIAITGSGNTLQYVDGTGALQSFPSLTGYVPYTGATANVNLGIYNLTAASLIKNGGTSGQFLKADGSVDSSAYIVLGSLSATAPLSYNNTTGVFTISQSGASTNGYLSSTDWNTFNNKQATITLTTTGSSGASTLIGNTLNIPNYANLVTSVFGRIGAVVATEGDYSLTQLSDVTITTPSSGQVLKYNGTAWVNDIDTDTGITSLNGLTALTQTFAVGTSGTDFAISSVTSTHTFNLPTASVSNRGALSSADWTTFNSKEPAITAGTTLQYYRGDKTFQTLNTTVVPEGTNLYYLDSRARTAISLTTTGSSGASTYNNTTGVFNIPDYGSALSGYVPTSRQLSINGTQYDLSADRSWSVGTVTTVSFTLGGTGTDLNSSVVNSTTTPAITLNVPTASAANRGALSAADWSTFNTKVGGVTATTPLFSSGGSTPNLTIQQSSGSQDGYLSSTDWTTFNNKQAAGNYITSLTGEATATGPGAAAVTLDNAAVTGKILTGVNITGGTILSTDSILTGFGKLQNQVNGLIGGSIYQGTWNANTNTPTLTSSVGTAGYYYIVSVAGTTNLNGITDWQVGDWAIFNGGVWQKVDNTDSVISVNGQTGAVSLTTDNISEGVTNLYFTNTRARAALSFVAGSGAYNSSTGAITIPTNTSQLTNGANFITLASLSGTAPISYNSGTGAISITQAATASNGYLSSTDWNTFNNKQATISLTTTGTSGAATLVGATLNIPNYGSALTGYVPYTGATANVDLGGFNITAGGTSSFVAATLTSNLWLKNTGSSDFIISNNTSLTTNVVRAYYTTTDELRFYAKNTAGASVVPKIMVGDGTTFTQLGTGTVTSVAALTIGTSGTDLSSSVANSTTTPVITLNVPTASATNRGALASADFTTFNNKQGTITLTTTGTSGAATFSANTLNIPDYGSALSGYVTLTTNQTISGVKTFSSMPILSAASGVNGQIVYADATNTLKTITNFKYDDATGVLTTQLGNLGSNAYTSTAYLPLTGGTLTGALSGTSATFSGDVSLSNSRFYGYNSTGLLYGRFGWEDSYGTTGAEVLSYGSSAYRPLKLRASQLDFYNNGTTSCFTIASTGAATFSSSVTSTAPSNALLYQFNGRSSDNLGQVLFYANNGSTLYSFMTSGSSEFILGTNASIPLNFYTANTERMRISSVGNFDYGGFNVQSSNNSVYRQAFWGAMSIMWRGAEDFYIDSNHTYSSSNTNVATYTSANGIGRLGIAGGTLDWGSYNGSVTAGTAYALTTRLTITSGGELQVSTANVRAYRSVSATTYPLDQNSFAGYIAMNSANVNGSLSGFSMYADSSYNAATGIFATRTSASTADMVFYAGSNLATERMRITSGGNVGIGTSSPSGKLDVRTSVNTSTIYLGTTATSQVADSGPQISFNGYLAGDPSSNYLHAAIRGAARSSTTNTNGGVLLFYTSEDSLAFTEKMRITSGGNVGIGTSSPAVKLHVNGQQYLGTASSTSGQLYLFHSSNDTRFDILNNGTEFKFAATYLSTAGYMPITFFTGDTERMRITSGGNVGIGTSSPSKLLHLYNTAATDVMLVESTQVFSTIAFKSSTNSSTVTVGIDGAGNAAFENKLTTGAMAFVTNGSERMRITSGGNVGIGTSSPSAVLDVAGKGVFRDNSSNATFTGGGAVALKDGGGSPYLSFHENTGARLGYIQMYGAGVAQFNVEANQALTISTNATERMRITSGGALCLGVTSAYGTNLLNVNGGIYATSSIAAVVAADIDMLAFVNTGATYSKACVVASMTATGGTGSYFFYGQQSTSTAAIKIFSNGNIQNTNNSYGAISDARLKENIKDATPKLDDLMKVKVRNYNLKGESNKQLGVISQELEAIFPNMIEESTNMGENMKIKGVKYSVFVPMLIKAVQELKAEIEILKNK